MLKKVAIGDMVMYNNRSTPAFEGVAIVTKTNLHGYPNVVEVEWITGGKGRGSVNLENCKVINK
jgi:hypothetical protein